MKLKHLYKIKFIPGKSNSEVSTFLKDNFIFAIEFATRSSGGDASEIKVLLSC
jgi:hypothetical protein